MSPSSRRTTALALLLAAGSSACISWGGQPVPQPSSGQQLPDPARITRADASTVVLHDAMVVGDSIVGYGEGAAESRERLAYPLGEVRKVEGRKVNFLATAGTTAVVVLVVGAAAIAVAISSLLG